MSLHVKLNQVIVIEPPVEKPYEFTDDQNKARKGVSFFAQITGLMTNGKIALVKLKGKSIAEVEAKLKSLGLVVGKPADIPCSSAMVVSGVTNVSA